ncbi:hypothetical protein BSKO_04942 [Bryopsis sp. KO-2023]|nr:hypothetical protein BSKO_04942 [Bryopsis sp. KO-2023]
MVRLLQKLSDAPSPDSASAKEFSSVAPDSRKFSQRLRKIGACFCPAPTPSSLRLRDEDKLRLAMGEKALLNGRGGSCALLCNVSPAEPGLEGSRSSTECPSKYSVDLLSDDCESDDLRLDLEMLEPTGENFAAVVAECGRLRSDKRRLQKTLNKLDAQMERVACECENVLGESNFRFKMAINTLAQLESTVKSLRGDIDKQGRHVAELTMERNMLQRQLDSAHQELRKSKSNSFIRIREDLATPRRR